MAFLRSVDERLLEGVAVAVTLTLRDCPADAPAFARIRNAWVARQKRAGLVRLHWVMELQRRGVPHLHVTAWYDADPGQRPLVDWVEVAKVCRPGLVAQDIRPFDGSMAWFEYVAKHTSRGHRHVQRSGLPPGWESSGRVWGHVGAWPLVEPETYDIDYAAWYRLRRLLRALKVSQVRRQPVLNPSALQRARQSLRCPVRHVSAVRGFSEWIEPDLQRLLVQAALRGSSAFRIPPPLPEPVEERPAQGRPYAPAGRLPGLPA